MSGIEILNSRIVYENRWMRVREDKIRRLSGREGLFGVVEKQDFAVILPVENNHIYIVEQFRYAVGRRCWELPQGTLENDPDANPSEIASRELREETGLTANEMTCIGHQYVAPGYSNQGYYIFVAKDLEMLDSTPEPEEEGLVTRRVSQEEFKEMLINGVIKDPTSATAYFIAKLKGAI